MVGLLNKYIFSIFTHEKELIEMRNEIFPFVLLVLGLDFWQVIFGGILRSLGLVSLSSLLYLVTYYVVLTPMSIIFAFYVSQHTNLDAIPRPDGKPVYA